MSSQKELLLFKFTQDLPALVWSMHNTTGDYYRQDQFLQLRNNLNLEVYIESELKVVKKLIFTNFFK